MAGPGSCRTFEKAAAQKKKDDAKLRVTQLAKKRRKEIIATEVRVAREAAEKVVEQKKAAKAAQAAEEATEKVDKDRAMPSQEQEIEKVETAEASIDLGTASTQLKCPHMVEHAGSRKKVKASKLSIDPITLIEGDLHDIGETVCDVTNEALQDFMQENQTVLGALRAQLHEL